MVQNFFLCFLPRFFSPSFLLKKIFFSYVKIRVQKISLPSPTTFWFSEWDVQSAMEKYYRYQYEHVYVNHILVVYMNVSNAKFVVNSILCRFHLSSWLISKYALETGLMTHRLCFGVSLGNLDSYCHLYLFIIYL